MSRSAKDMETQDQVRQLSYVPASAKEWDGGQGLQVRVGEDTTEQWDEQMFGN